MKVDPLDFPGSRMGMAAGKHPVGRPVQPHPPEASTRPGRASAAPSAQDDVGDVPVIGRWVDARLDRVQLDRECVA